MHAPSNGSELYEHEIHPSIDLKLTAGTLSALPYSVMTHPPYSPISTPTFESTHGHRNYQQFNLH
jgi:hypothetical protein